MKSLCSKRLKKNNLGVRCVIHHTDVQFFVVVIMKSTFKNALTTGLNTLRSTVAFRTACALCLAGAMFMMARGTLPTGPTTGIATSTMVQKHGSPDEAPICAALQLASSTSREASTVINRPLMVYVGAASIRQPGFISLYRTELDVTKADDYARWFCKSSVDSFLTEHTFEHIPEDLHEGAFRLMHKYLKSGGRLRIAVPLYKEAHVARPADVEIGHVAFITKRSLTAALNRAGFNKIRALEYVDVQTHTAHTEVYDSCDGRVRRSVRHDARNLEWLAKNLAFLNKTEHNDIGKNVIRPPPPVVSVTLDAIKD